MRKNFRKAAAFLIVVSMAASVMACGGRAPADRPGAGPAQPAETAGPAAESAAGTDHAAAQAAADQAENGGQEESENAGQEKAGTDLPAVGEELYGFRVTDITPFPQKNAQIVSMDHVKSGAELMYIACDDTDKAFNVFFRTVAESDQGIPHVFEHVTLSGSGKYPNSNLFEGLADKTYNTYMNAGTMQHVTEYNMSSLSEDQLLKIMDYYMDGLTDPLALRDEHPLRRESFRYELDDPEAEVSVTGAVFNEMEAANAKIDRYVRNITYQALYPESTMSFNSGGYRDDILTITMDQLKAFHEKYYHPSNMLIVMYGDLDARRFLEVLDRDYLSRYDKKEVKIEDPRYEPWTGERTGNYAYPVTEDSSGEDGSVITYAVSLGEISPYDLQLMSVAGSLLNAESSVLRQEMVKNFPGSVFEVNVDWWVKQPAVIFTLRDAAEGDAEKFHAVLKEALGKICEDGLNKDLVDPIVRNQQLSTILSAEEPGGIGTSELFGICWGQWGSRLAYLDCFRAVENLREEADKGTLDRLVEKYLKAPVQAVLIEVDPEPGRRELLDGEFAKKLADMKASMSEDEVAALVERTEEFHAWTEKSAEEAPALLEQLKAVGIGDLPETVKDPEVTDADEAGIRKITSVIGNAPYVSSELLLDASSLEFDEIHDFVFLGELLGNLATEKYSLEKLETALASAAYRQGIAPEIIYSDADGKPHPYLSVAAMELEEMIPDVWDLQEEILYHTDFSDAERIRYLASAAATGYVSGNSQRPDSIAVQCGIAAADPNRRYEFHANQFDYLAYLKRVSRMSDAETAALAERLQKVLGKLLNRNGAVFTAVGSEEALEKNWNAAGKLIGKLDDTVREPADYTEELEKNALPKRLAVTIPDAVNYNGYVALNQETGLERNGKDTVLAAILKNELLYPEFRFRIGAYGFMNAVGRTNSYMLTYRDPDIRPSYDYYQKLPEKIRELKLTQDEVNDSILSTYSGLAYPESPLKAAQSAIYHVLQDHPESYGEEALRMMREAKTVTPEDVTGAADKIGKMIDSGVRITAGNSAAIKKNAGLYDLVIEDLTK